MDVNAQIVLAKANYDKAKETKDAAKKALDDLKASGESIVKAYEAAKAAFNGLRPSLDLANAKLKKAEAELTIAHAEYAAVAPKDAAAEKAKKGAGNAAILEAVKGLLTGKPEGMSNSDLYDGVIATGLTLAGDKPRDNFNSYLSRWGTAGTLVRVGDAKWALPGAVAAPPTGEQPSLPPVFTPPAAPAEASLPPVFTPPPSATTLAEDFPGYEPLKAAGYETRESLAGKSADDLTAIPGIGAKTAAKILEALAG